MKKERKLETFSIRLDPDTKAALERMAAADERSVSAYVARVLREHVASSKQARPRV